MVKKKSTQLTATVNATLIPPVPVGTIVPYGALLANNLPTGWLYCNGSEYPKAQYPQLYPIILDTYGTAKSTNNGLLPDLRGYFIRGYDDLRGIDPGRRMGSLQDDAFRSHTHGQKVTANPNTGSCTRSDFNGDAKTYSEYEQGVQTNATGGIETRPKNMATYFVIYAGVYKPAVRKPDKKSKKDQTKTRKSAAGRGRAGATGRRGGR
jgi:microcystin-dependent protein